MHGYLSIQKKIASERILELKFRCYHCGKKDKVKRFCSDPNFLPISSHPMDNKWAGPGMYLWDTKANANWWYSSREDNYERKICKCILSVEEDLILDMTDTEVVERANYLIEKIQASEDISSDSEVGEKISFIAKKIRRQVIKLFGNYPRRPQLDFFEASKQDTTKAHVGITSNVIYCVKKGNSNLLKNREIEG